MIPAAPPAFGWLRCELVPRSTIRHSLTVRPPCPRLVKRQAVPAESAAAAGLPHEMQANNSVAMHCSAWRRAERGEARTASHGGRSGWRSAPALPVARRLRTRRCAACVGGGPPAAESPRPRSPRSVWASGRTGAAWQRPAPARRRARCGTRAQQRRRWCSGPRRQCREMVRMQRQPCGSPSPGVQGRCNAVASPAAPAGAHRRFRESNPSEARSMTSGKPLRIVSNARGARRGSRDHVEQLKLPAVAGGSHMARRGLVRSPGGWLKCNP